MRLCLTLTLALAFLGCGKDNGSGNDDLSATSDGGGGAGGGGDVNGDGGQGGDGSVMSDGGTVAGACKTACDCKAGQACAAGKCQMGSKPIYCCGAMNCPNGKLCEDPSGNFANCMMGPPDLAGFDQCSLFNCMGKNGVQDCMKFGCTMCVNTMGGGDGMVCAK